MDNFVQRRCLGNYFDAQECRVLGDHLLLSFLLGYVMLVSLPKIGRFGIASRFDVILSFLRLLRSYILANGYGSDVIVHNISPKRLFFGIVAITLIFHGAFFLSFIRFLAVMDSFGIA